MGIYDNKGNIMTQTELPGMPRPKVERSMIVQAAAKTAEDMTGFGETLAEDIASQYYRRDSGYDLAKKLEDIGYSCKMHDLDDLDQMDDIVDDLLDDAQRQWAKVNNIQRTLPDGARVKYGPASRNWTGVIAGIYERGPAQYRIKKDGCQELRRFSIVNFEDAVELSMAEIAEETCKPFGIEVQS